MEDYLAKQPLEVLMFTEAVTPVLNKQEGVPRCCISLTWGPTQEVPILGLSLSATYSICVTFVAKEMPKDEKDDVYLCRERQEERCFICADPCDDAGKPNAPRNYKISEVHCCFSGQPGLQNHRLSSWP